MFFKRFSVFSGGAISQAKGAFSSWWSNLLVSPETGQKGAENVDVVCSAEEVEQGDETDATDIPKSTINEQVCNGSMKGNENCKIKDVAIEENHIPGEIHTV